MRVWYGGSTHMEIDGKKLGRFMVRKWGYKEWEKVRKRKG